jgi:hypothetical protein
MDVVRVRLGREEGDGAEERVSGRKGLAARAEVREDDEAGVESVLKEAVEGDEVEEEEDFDGGEEFISELELAIGNIAGGERAETCRTFVTFTLTGASRVGGWNGRLRTLVLSYFCKPVRQASLPPYSLVFGPLTSSASARRLLRTCEPWCPGILPTRHCSSYGSGGEDECGVGLKGGSAAGMGLR